MAQRPNHWETAIYSNDTWKYFVGNSEPNTFWRLPLFDDAMWLQGKGGIGYGDGDDSTVVVNCFSVFMRKVFTVSDTSKLVSAILSIDYDDAFVAYLNGIEIARSGIVGAYPPYNSACTDHEAKLYLGGAPEQFTVTKQQLAASLVNGLNVFSVQVHNTSNGSSDLTAIPYLHVGIKDDKTYYRPNPTWFLAPDQSNSFTTRLPIVSIVTNDRQAIPDNGVKITATMRVIDKGSMGQQLTDSANNYFGIIGIEGRGASSSSFPQKSYNIETRTAGGANRDESLLGMPIDNDWWLIGNFNDKTMVRNTLSHALFQRMGHYAPRTRHVEVFINNEYQGIYFLAEKIKRGKNRVDIKKADVTVTSGDKLSGGYIFKNDNKDANEQSYISNYSESGMAGVREVHYIYVEPKSDEISDAQKTYFAGFINSFETALYGNQFTHPSNGYKKYIDINSFIDYFIISEVSRNVDAYKKSKFYHKDADSNGGLIVSGPTWDFDWAYKNIPEGNQANECYYGVTDGSAWAYKALLCNHSPKMPGWVPRMMRDTVFVNLLKTRYVDLRKTILSTESIYRYIDSTKNYLIEAQARHFQKWDLLGKATIGSPEVDAQPGTYEAAINQIKNWINIRLTWLDKNMPGRYGITTPLRPTSETVHLISFPNPVHSQFYLQAAKKIKQVSIHSLYGQTIHVEKSDAYQLIVDTQHLVPGTYMVTVQYNDHSTSVVKMVKK